MRQSFFVSCFMLLVAAGPQLLWAQGAAARRPPLATGPSASVATAAAATAKAVASAEAAPKTGPAAMAAGTWTGTLPIAGQPVAVSLGITRQGNSYRATLDIPGGAVRQRRLQVTERNDTLRMREFSLDVQFTCAVSPDGQLLSGRCAWVQLGSPMPVAFHRGAASDAANASAGKRVSRTAVDTKWENGTLENGQPVGIWNYYQKDDAGDYVLIRSYDHSARQLTFARPGSQPFDAELQPGVWERTLLTQAPWFVGPHDALTSYGSKLTYPVEARQHHIEGKVWVTFAVDTLGRVSDHRVLKGLGHGCDEEALRVARTIPDTWTPGHR